MQEGVVSIMKTKRVNAIKRYGPTVAFWLIIDLILAVIFLFLLTGRGCERTEPEAEPTPLPPGLYVITPSPEPTPAEMTQEEKEEALIQAVLFQDAETGLEIDCGVSYWDLLWLSRAIAVESGPDWPDCYMMMIGEVILNRQDSFEYPDTIYDILYDPGQYAAAMDGTLDDIRPREHVVRLALRLLKGERVLNDRRVLFQALYPQGSKTVAFYYDDELDTTTYFCWASHPELYEMEGG